MALLEIIFEFVAEVLLQVFLEALTEFGLQGLREMFQWPKKAHPFLAVVGYGVLGAGVGALSVLIFPTGFIQEKWMRILNLVVTPIVSGFAMVSLGCWRRYRNQELIRLDHFTCGFVFALAMALVRWILVAG